MTKTNALFMQKVEGDASSLEDSRATTAVAQMKFAKYNTIKSLEIQQEVLFGFFQDKSMHPVPELLAFSSPFAFFFSFSFPFFFFPSSFAT
jgi:hypothetical protein